MILIITVDTEEDNQWEQGNIITTENINHIQRFQDLCNRYNLKPTYLCTYEVVKSQEFDRILKAYHAQGIAEIGAHLHPWTNPPLERHSLIDLHGNPYPSELSLEIFKEKMEELTNIIYSKTDLKPISYRAGRWGFCAPHIPVLLDLGYKVDCSVTPLISWENVPGFKEGGPDFREAPVEPYYLDFGNACLEGKSKLLEVPVTILFINHIMYNRYFRNHFFKYKNTLAGRILDKIFRLNPQWFRPFPYMTAKRLKDVYLEANRLSLPVIEMMFHSSELMPGCSPYYPSQISVENLYSRFKNLFEFISKNNGKSMTLGEFAEKYSYKS